MTKGAYVADELIRLKFRGRLLSFRRASRFTAYWQAVCVRLRGRGLNFEEIPAFYQPGDDIHSIDWKVTAPVQPHCRVYAERARPASVDCSRSANQYVFGSQRAINPVTRSRETAALAAWRVIEGSRPGAVIFNDSEIVEIRPHRSQQRCCRSSTACCSKTGHCAPTARCAPVPST